MMIVWHDAVHDYASQVFPRNGEERDVTCHLLTKEFLIYATRRPMVGTWQQFNCPCWWEGSCTEPHVAPQHSGFARLRPLSCHKFRALASRAGVWA